MCRTEKEVIDMFHELYKKDTLDLISAEKILHMPIWECEGEKYSEFESFFLMKIGETPGITVNELQKMWGRTQGAASQRLIIFEERGLVYKQKSEKDRRYTEVCLTEKGRKVYETIAELKWQHSKDAVDVMLEHGYSLEDIYKGIEMYQVLAEYGDDCKHRVWKV